MFVIFLFFLCQSSFFLRWENNNNNTFYKADKSRTNPVTNWSNKSTQIEKISEINIHRDNLSVFVLSGQGESLASVTPDQIYIPRKNKREKTPDSLVIRKKPTGDTVNPRKRSQYHTVTDVEKGSQHKTPWYFWNKEYY